MNGDFLAREGNALTLRLSKGEWIPFVDGPFIGSRDP